MSIPGAISIHVKGPCSTRTKIKKQGYLCLVTFRYARQARKPMVSAIPIPRRNRVLPESGTIFR